MMKYQFVLAIISFFFIRCTTISKDTTQPVWKVPIRKSLKDFKHFKALTVQDDYLYLATSNSLAAIDMQSGSIEWETLFNLQSDNAELLYDGLIYYSTNDSLISVNPKNGSRVWAIPTSACKYPLY